MIFQKFNKIPRLSRDMVITEKIDGSSGQICIVQYEQVDKYDVDFITQYGLNLPEDFDEGTFNFRQQDLYVFAGSRNRWLDCSKNGDNMGFAKWVKENAEELMGLGEGRHFGEWYGNGIQRKYELDEKRFALFNVKKWVTHDFELKEEDKREHCPKCCEVVPILYEGMFDTAKIAEVLEKLRIDGSSAVPGYLNPEGIVIYHKASGQLFKKTIIGDKKPKGICDET